MTLKVALFVPCFIDAFYPEVGIATLELLERLGVDVTYPLQQTCCGQPIANSGAVQDAAGTHAVFARNFADYDYIVGPSSSCINHIQHHFTGIEQTPAVRKIRANAWELTAFLHEVVGVRAFPWAAFPYRVGLHESCSALRHLRTATASEIVRPAAAVTSMARTLLAGVRGIEFVTPQRPDECCGFGGTFSVSEAAVSVKMGRDKVADHLRAGAEYIVSADMSCLMHQQGCADHAGMPGTDHADRRLPPGTAAALPRFAHIAQVLNGSAVAATSERPADRAANNAEPPL